jgi:multimeric flavodoxin WrbA
MKAPKKALLIAGSPKGPKGSSWELGLYVLSGLKARGIELRTRSIRDSESDLFNDIAWADLVVLSFPLFADGVPAVLKTLMLKIANARTGTGKGLAVIVNCGFIESHQNDVAIEMCSHFANEAGFEWLGGVGRGGGGMIDGKPLEKMGGLFRDTKSALDQMAEALAQGTPVPVEAIAMIRKPLAPKFMYLIGASLGFVIEIVRRGTLLKTFRRLS